MLLTIRKLLFVVSSLNHNDNHLENHKNKKMENVEKYTTYDTCAWTPNSVAHTFEGAKSWCVFEKQSLKCNLYSAISGAVLLCDVECKLCDAVFPVLSMACSPCCAVFAAQA